MERECRDVSCYRSGWNRRSGVEEIDMRTGRPSRVIYGRMGRADRERVAITSLTFLHQIEIVYFGLADPRRDAVIWGINEILQVDSLLADRLLILPGESDKQNSK